MLIFSIITSARPYIGYLKSWGDEKDLYICLQGEYDFDLIGPQYGGTAIPIFPNKMPDWKKFQRSFPGEHDIICPRSIRSEIEDQIQRTLKLQSFQ